MMKHGLKSCKNCYNFAALFLVQGRFMALSFSQLLKGRIFLTLSVASRRSGLCCQDSNIKVRKYSFCGGVDMLYSWK
jgi:hypothetical protein